MKNNFIYFYLLLINIVSFLLFGIDKYKAKFKKWRIPEKTLLFTTFFGGIIGSWFAMFIFRHKIKDMSFLPFQVLITIFWVIIFLYFNNKYVL